MLYSENDAKSALKQMIMYIILVVLVFAAGVTASLIIGIKNYMILGGTILVLTASMSIFLFGIFVAPCFSYYKYVMEVLTGKARIRRGRIMEIAQKPVMKDNKIYFYEIKVETDKDLYGLFLFDANLEMPEMHVGQEKKFACYENYIAGIIE